MWIYLCKTVCDNCKTLHFLLQQIAATIVKSLGSNTVCKKNGVCDGDSLMHVVLSCAHYYEVLHNFF